MDFITQLLGIIVVSGTIVGWIIWLTNKITRHDTKIESIEQRLDNQDEKLEETQLELKEFRMESIRLLTELKTIVNRIENSVKP